MRLVGCKFLIISFTLSLGLSLLTPESSWAGLNDSGTIARGRKLRDGGIVQAPQTDPDSDDSSRNTGGDEKDPIVEEK